MRVLLIALCILAASATSSLAATSTGAVLIPGIISEYPAYVVPSATIPPTKPFVVTPVAPATKPAVGAVSAAPQNRALSRGMSGADVKWYQTRLATLGYLQPESTTGFFGALTEAAVKTFQKEHGVVSSGTAQSTGFGLIGAKTRLAMQNATPGGAPGAPGVYSPVLTSASVPQNSTTNSAVNTQVPVVVFPTTVLTPTLSQAQASAPISCPFGGQLMPSGTAVTMYQSPGATAESPQCVSEARVCNNGTLSGSYQYFSCTPLGAQTSAPSGGSSADTSISCVWNGATVAAGASVSAYQAATVPNGSICLSESRTCVNGALSGSFAFSACQVSAPLSCTFNGQTVANGATVSAYQSSVVAAGGSCLSQIRVCQNGTMTGSYQSASCIVSSSSAPPPANCSFNGTLVIAGTSVTAYQTSSVAYGSSCVSQTRSCTNGSLTGSYTYASCQPSAPSACTFNGSAVAHGAAVTAYQAASVAAGNSCVSQSRTCTNGSLSGSYAYAACTVAAPTTCTLGGQTIANGSSVLSFQNTVVGSDNSCVPQTRTCNSGTLSGNSAFQYDHCSVQSDNAPLPNMFVPAVSNGTNVQLHAWYATPGGAGPYPVIILAHGCAGINPEDPYGLWSQMDSWGATFRSWGYATLIVDSFTARGVLNGVCSSGAVIPSERAIDIYSAATVLAKTAGVNPQKIGVFGVSHGANAVSWATRNDLYTTATAHAALTAAGGTIRAGATLYPNCDTALNGVTFYAPYFVAIGAADDWASNAVCELVTNYPTVSGTPVDVSGYGSLLRITVYPNVTHSFDLPGLTTVHLNTQGHYIAYNPTVLADVQARMKAFFDSFLK